MFRFTLPRAALRRTLGIWTVALVAACTSGVPAATPGASAPAPTAAPTRPAPTAQPTPKPSATERPAAPAFTTWGDWIADVPALPEIGMAAGLLQLSIDWQDGKALWLQTSPDYRQVLQSTSLAAASVDEIRVRTAEGNSHCSRFAEGRYRWSRSEDGLFLTLTLIEDACATRASLFARTWVHSHGAVNDGGLGVNYGVEPKIQMTLPVSEGQRWAMSGGQVASPELKTFNADPFRAFVVVANPGGFEQPCSAAQPSKVAIEPTTAAFADYVKKLPDATVTTSDTKVGGRPAVRLDVTIAATTCAADGFRAFRPEDPGDPYEWWFAPGEHQPLYIVQIDPTTTFLLWYQGPDGEEAEVIESISFIDKVPTP